jgi:hypothetical protein
LRRPALSRDRSAAFLIRDTRHAATFAPPSPPGLPGRARRTAKIVAAQRRKWPIMSLILFLFLHVS